MKKISFLLFIVFNINLCFSQSKKEADLTQETINPKDSTKREQFLANLAKARADGDKIAEAGILQKLAPLEATKFRFVAAFDRYIEMLNACKAVNDSICVGRAYSRIGHIHMLKNEFPKALEMLSNGIEILNQFEKKDPYHLTGSLEEMVYLYWKLDLLDKAEEFSLRSLAIRKHNRMDSFLLSKSARLVGETYFLKDSLEKAQHYLRMAADYTLRPNHLLHGALARLAERNGNLQAGLYHSERALEYVEQVQGKRRRPIPYITAIKDVGDAYFKLERYRSANTYYERAISVAQKEQLTYETAGPIYKSLAITEQYLGNYEKALESHLAGEVLLDSMRRAASEEIIQELEMKYKARQQEEQINILNTKNQRRTIERNLLLGGAIVFLLLSLLIWQINESRRKIINNLAAQKAETEQVIVELKATQSQLLQSEKMASLGQLTAGIAHEINNPINFITTNVAALKMDFKDLFPLLQMAKDIEQGKEQNLNIEDIRKITKSVEVSFVADELTEIISSIERGVDRTTQIIKNLKNFTRKADENFELSDLNAGLESTLMILKSELKTHEINLDLELNNIPLVYCNIGLLNQVFINVITNAIHATRNQVVKQIKVSTFSDEATVSIAIKDTGMGMDEHTLNRIFEPFFTTKEVGTGTGLGLSISYNIIRQHKGTIKVESQPDKGTTFLIELPIAPTDSTNA